MAARAGQATPFGTTAAPRTAAALGAADAAEAATAASTNAADAANTPNAPALATPASKAAAGDGSPAAWLPAARRQGPTVARPALLKS